MATTMTDGGEILYTSFPIDKTETDGEGNIVVFGKASDGGLDSDQQIVDPAWMAKAVQDWMASGPNIRVQHSPQRDPAGVGLEASTDAAGNTWVKGLVVEPVAQKLVAKGALRAYSVGIARPTIVRDGTAPGGRITGGELVEISLVDRPANKRCGIQLVKSADGAVEYVNEVFGSQEDIAKALGAEIGKSAVMDAAPVTQADISVVFTPNDLMKIMQNKFVEKHYDELAFQAVAEVESDAFKEAARGLNGPYRDGVDVAKDHRDFSADRRKDLASQGHALPDGSYPIPDADALRRAAVLARSGHGNVSAAKALIARRARELGVTNPLDDDAEKTIEATEVKEAEPAVTKDPAGDTPAPKKGKKKNKKMPPWLAGDDGDASEKADTPDDDDDDDVENAVKCSPSGTPQSASGAKDAVPMKEIPSTSAAPESPLPAGLKSDGHSNPETAAMLRFKTIGIDTDLGRLHDLTCAAFHPDDVSKYHPYADFRTVIDTSVWQRKAIDAACGPLQKAMAMTEVWQAAETLKNADLADLNDFRLEAHKAFRDANPGPTSYPSPGSISPDKYNRPLITDGHSASSPGHDGPNSSANVASGPVQGAGSFSKPPLSAGHQSPSPSFMKNTWEYPKNPGVPTSLPYAYLEKEKARRALSMMHDHLSHAFPAACPMLDQDAYRVESTPAVTPAVGVGKNAEPVVEKTDDLDVFVEKARKKLRKKLGKKVLAGEITVDEARGKLGRDVAQKAEELKKQEFINELTVLVNKGEISVNYARGLLGLEPLPDVTDKVSDVTEGVIQVPESIAKSAVAPVQPVPVDSDLIKSAVSDAVKPLLEQLQVQNKQIEELTAYKVTSDQRFEALANIADPSTNAFTGMAVNPVKKSARPAGVLSQAEIAERTQQMMIRQLQRTWRTSENPAEREAAYTALQKYQTD